MKKLLIVMLVMLICPSAVWPEAPQPVTPPDARPLPKIHKVVIISVDGLRPDLALRANTPVIHTLLAAGSFTFWARTTAESVTLPSHTSMVTGVQPIKHGIQWNADLPGGVAVYPAYPTIFQLAHKAGYSTAMVAGKSKFVSLAVPNSLDWQFIPTEQKLEDPQVAAVAVKLIADHQPDLLFVHLPSVDNTGHAKGWSSPEQMTAIETTDHCIGDILAALDAAKVRDQTMILVTADHGGAGLSHGPDDARSRHIPWIVVGPGIRRGFDLTIYGELQIDTEDTFTTTAAVLGIPVQRKVEGKFVDQIVDKSGQELLVPTK